ncbi:MAG: efflux RND transporter periplasmic adaptor subunit [Elusimicrobiaceae bacterium]|nr:efflux RND transporter periplasmic adaptor subunit [Elusimicrobiaceae bacterium]
MNLKNLKNINKKKAIVFIAILLLIIMVTKSCFNKKVKFEMPPTAVEVENMQNRNVLKTVILSATLDAKRDVILYPRTTGKYYKTVRKEGSKVKKNDTIALIERDEIGATYERLKVEATISGIVGDIYPNVGDRVDINTPIALIVSPGTIRAKVKVPQLYYPKLKVGNKAFARVDSYPDKIFTGKIYLIKPVVDSSKRTVDVEIVIDNDEGMIKHGMFANVELVLDGVFDKPSIPTRAIKKDEKGKYVFVLGAENKAEKRYIQTGFETDMLTEVISGISNEEKVVIVDFGLTEGETLVIIEK